MKTLQTALAGGLMVCATAVSADITMNVNMTTDYVFRGISQSGNGPAIQGGIDADLAIPFAPNHTVYIGYWGSSVDIEAANGIEYDLYMGSHGPIAFGVGYDFQIIYYNYQQANELDFIEGHFGLDRDFGDISVSGAVNFTADYYDSTGEAYYWDVNASMPLPYGFTAGVHMGYQTLSDEGRFFDGATPADSYKDYSLSISRELLGLGLALTAFDNDIDTDTCTVSECDDRIVFSVSKEL